MSSDGSANLLYLHSDQHSPFVAGCCGDPLVETPHIDGLARRGVLLENTYCPSPICVPSRMSMLPGRFPHENRVWTHTHVLDSAGRTSFTATPSAWWATTLPTTWAAGGSTTVSSPEPRDLRASVWKNPDPDRAPIRYTMKTSPPLPSIT